MLKGSTESPEQVSQKHQQMIDRYNCWERRLNHIISSLENQIRCKFDDVDSLQNSFVRLSYNALFSIVYIFNTLITYLHRSIPGGVATAWKKPPKNVFWKPKGFHLGGRPNANHFWPLLSGASFRSFIFSYANALISIFRRTEIFAALRLICVQGRINLYCRKDSRKIPTIQVCSGDTHFPPAKWVPWIE